MPDSPEFRSKVEEKVEQLNVIHDEKVKKHELALRMPDKMLLDNDLSEQFEEVICEKTQSVGRLEDFKCNLKLGLHGAGGIGKTTICKMLLNEYEGRECHTEVETKATNSISVESPWKLATLLTAKNSEFVQYLDKGKYPLFRDVAEIRSRSFRELAKETDILATLLHTRLPHFFNTTVQDSKESDSATELLQKKLQSQLTGPDSEPNIKYSIDSMLQMSRAMLYMQEREFVYRDLKASNVLVANPVDCLSETGYICVKLADFGLVKVPPGTESLALSLRPRRVGNNSYMAPKILIDRRSAPQSIGTEFWRATMDQPTLPDPRVVVGLDFGTTFSGFAYAHTSAPEHIFTQYDWPMYEQGGGKLYCKTLTGAYYERGSDGKLVFHSWGWPARVAYLAAVKKFLQAKKKDGAEAGSAKCPTVGEMLTKFKLHLASEADAPPSADDLPESLKPEQGRPISNNLERQMRRASCLKRLSCTVGSRPILQLPRDEDCHQDDKSSGPVRSRSALVGSRTWSTEEILALLETCWVEEIAALLTKTCLLESMQDADPAASAHPKDARLVWSYVSERLFEEHGFDRASTSCRILWGSLMRCYNAIRDHELKIYNGTTDGPSYFEMDKEERSKNMLPAVFDLEWCQMIETILKANPAEVQSGTTQLDADKCTGYSRCEESLCAEADFEIEESEEEDESCDSAESEVELSRADCHDPQTKPSHFIHEHKDRIDASPSLRNLVEDMVRPLITALRSREEEKQKHRQKVLAAEMDKVALVLQDIRRVLVHSNEVRGRGLLDTPSKLISVAAVTSGSNRKREEVDREAKKQAVSEVIDNTIFVGEPFPFAQQQLLNYHSSLLPQWQTKGHMNSEAAESGGTSAENNASSHPLKLPANQAPSAMIDVDYTSDVAALPRFFERPSPLAQKQPVSDDVFNTSETVTDAKRKFHAFQHFPAAQQTKRIRGPNWTGVINWPTQEDGVGNVVVNIVNLPILADAATLVHSLRDAASYWRSQEKKALWLMLPIEYCKTILPPAVMVGFSIHQVCSTYFMLVLTFRDNESYALHTIDVNQYEGGLHFNTNDVLEKDEEQYRSSMLPQWQTRGHRNPESAERGGTSAENNASSQPLELVVNLAPSGMIDLGSDSQADALLRCIERPPSTWAQQQPGSEEPARTTSKRRSDTSQHNPAAQQTKRIRGPNWTRDQKLYLLTHMLNYKLRQKHAEAGEPGDWFHSASRSYKAEHDILIEPGKWQDQMDSLWKQFKAIRSYEWEIQSGTSKCVSYWKLSEDERRIARRRSSWLPLSFDQDMFQLVEKIHQIQKENKLESSRARLEVQVLDLRQSSSNLHMDSTISESSGPSDGNKSSHQDLHSSDIGSLEWIEGESVDLNVGNMLQRSTASTIYEEVIARISPFVHQLIDDALQPLPFAMRKREEDEENHRMKMLSTQAQQLAVMRQEKELTRNGVYASTYGAPIGDVDSIVNPIFEHGQDALLSYLTDVDPEEVVDLCVYLRQ